MQAVEEPECSVTVVSNIDGKHYKLVMKGDIGLLAVQKIKRYLQQATGFEPREQRLTFEQRLLLDHEHGSDFGLRDGAVIVLAAQPEAVMRRGGSTGRTGDDSPHRPPLRAVTAASPAKPLQTCSAPPSPTPAFVRSAEPMGTQLPAVDWHAKEIQRIREEERQRYEIERKRREEQEMEREIDRVRVQERNRLLETDFRETEKRLKIEIERLKSQLLREERIRQELKETIQRLEEDHVCQAEAAKEDRRRAELEKERYIADREATDKEMEALIKRQQLDIDTLRLENIEFQRKLREQHVLSASLHTTPQQHASLSALPAASPRRSSQEVLSASLQHLSQELGVPALALDDHQTCILTIPNQQTNLIFTYDPSTERLFMYTTLLNHLPADASSRHALYEELLQGALLGRDMAGGSVGVSKSGNRIVLLSVSFDLRFVSEFALRASVRPFVAAAQHWTAVCQRIAAPQASQSSPTKLR